MAAWDKDLDKPAHAWEKDLDRPSEDKKPTKTKPSFGEMLKEEALSSLPAQVLGIREYLSGDPAQIAAAPPTRFAVGAGAPIIGIADRIAGNSNVLQNFGALAKEGGATGFDAAGLTGNVLSPVSLLAGKIRIPKSIPGRMAVGAGVGGAGGFLAPAADNEEAARNALLGAVFGGAVPPVIQGIGKTAEAGMRGIRSLSDLVTPSGPMNIARGYINKIVGPQNMSNVLDRVRTAQELIPRSRPTIGEVVADLPEGSPLIALQEITSKTKGGPSAKFAERAYGQQDATEAAMAARKAITDPMREAALSAANKTGVKSDSIIAQIDAMAAKPGDRASDVVSKTLGTVRNKIDRLTDEAGVINAQDLYTIRKEVGNTISQHAKDSANWDKKLASKLEREIQLQIDEAIKKAGGTGWDDYLKEFASRSRAIDADAARRELAKNPLQRTNLGGGINVGEETRPHLPNLLSRPAMALNFLLRKAGAGVEPKIDAAMTEILLHPERFDQVMSKLPPGSRIDVQRALQNANALSFGGASAQ